MKIITILQNTPEWEALRAIRIGASDANIIMGLSDYCTIRELWSLKCGLTKKDPDENTFAQDKGHRLEVKNRATLEIEYGVDFPAVTALSDLYEFLMASLDGLATVENVWDEEKGCWVADPHYVLAEFKYCGQADFEIVKAGQPLPQYKPQLQTQLTVTGARYLILGVTTEDKEAIAREIERLKAIGAWIEGETKEPKIYKYARCTVLPDLAYIEHELLPALVKFQNSVINKIDPGYGPYDVKDESDNEALMDALSRYKLMKEDLENTTALVEKTKKEIFSMITHTKSMCGNASVMVIQKSAPTTTVIDYKKFCEDNNITIPEEYIYIDVGPVPDPIHAIKFVKSEAEKELEAKEKEERKAALQAEKDQIKKDKEEAKLKAADDKKAAADKKAQDKIDDLRRKEEEKAAAKLAKEQEKEAAKKAKEDAKAAAKAAKLQQ